ncbi:Rv2578c family radical SAM protein [Streptomyces sp. NPDC102364]|uniref:Rv2578c family radical SAM protein n=1 Tax=Streptomyces sp. NPDC102364 TaxID=3366161 RepID=UPI003827EEE1
MRWDHLTDSTSDTRAAGFFTTGAVRTRSFDAPEFRGITFHEVHAKSIVNRVPDTSRMPFDWTLNPYRGCTHACTYCFARTSHRYLDLNPGPDFDNQIVVKVNAAELLHRRLNSPRWQGEHIALGANVDCYQRAEGRYRLMPGILAALRDHANPFSILTKGSLILRDLELLRQATQVTRVHVAVSIGFTDSALWRTTEPGTPPPPSRLDTIRALTEAGIEVGVLMMPILPFIGDSPQELRATVHAIAESGASWLTPAVLYLQPGVRDWFMHALRQSHPTEAPRYERLYAAGAYAPHWYRERITREVTRLAGEFGIAVRPESDHWDTIAADTSAKDATGFVQSPLF